MENKDYIIVKIKMRDGAIQKFNVDERPIWEDDIIYITRSERGMILFNWNNVISYSEKVISKKPSETKVNDNEED